LNNFGPANDLKGYVDEYKCSIIPYERFMNDLMPVLDLPSELCLHAFSQVPPSVFSGDKRELYPYLYKAIQLFLRDSKLVCPGSWSVLDEYLDSYELCLSVFFSLVAHQDAWEKANILHRDISCANILIDEGYCDPNSGQPEFRACLND